MTRSEVVNVVFTVDPADDDYDLDATVVAINGGGPGNPPNILPDGAWAEDHFQTSGFLLDELFGDVDDAPAEVLAGGKFLARGRMVGQKTYSMDGDDFDQWFELHAWRKLTG